MRFNFENYFKDFLSSIFVEKTQCDRHDKYVKADSKTRKALEFCCPGPLEFEEQTKLAQLINDICPDATPVMVKFPKYNYDVLYPEGKHKICKQKKWFKQFLKVFNLKIFI